MLKNDYFKKAAFMITEPVDQKTHIDREKYFLKKLESNKEFADSSMGLFNAIHTILQNTSTLHSEESVYAFRFIRKSLGILEKDTSPYRKHFYDTCEMMRDFSIEAVTEHQQTKNYNQIVVSEAEKYLKENNISRFRFAG